MKSSNEEIGFDRLREYLADLAQEEVSGRPRYLFRGQSRIYDSLTPTATRLLRKGPVFGKASLWVCQEANRIRSGFTGYSPRGILDVVALLQHYRWWTPLLDLTGSPEIALWFAHAEWNPGQNDMAIICVIDTLNAEWVSAGIPSETTEYDKPVIVDHDFLLSPLNQGGLRARWVRQDGYAVTIKGWRDPECVERFDLLSLQKPHSSLLCQALRFRFLSNYKHDLGNLYDEVGDPLPASVQGCLRILLSHLATNERLDPKTFRDLRKRADGIYEGPEISGATSLSDLSDLLLKPSRWTHIAFLVWFVRLVGGGGDEEIRIGPIQG